MRRLRVLVLLHPQQIPPDSPEGFSDKEMAPWKDAFDVISAVENLGHEVRIQAVLDDLTPIREAILEWKPQITFNLLEEFAGVGTYDQHVVAYLELMRQPYTGCNPRGLMLTRDKALSKKILTYHRIPTPGFAVFPAGRANRRPKRLRFPLLVKSLTEDASLGISKASVVSDDEKLKERVAFIHESVGTDALVEEFIRGRELYVGVLGNQRLQTFPVWEMRFTKVPEGVPRIATAKVKWDLDYQQKLGVETGRAKDLPPDLERRIVRLCRRAYRTLNMSGYGRMDLRLDEDGRVWIIEANGNPNLEYGEDFAESAGASGLSYDKLVHRILRLGLGYHAPWKDWAVAPRKED